MGFESFRVELAGGPATFEQAAEAVRRLPRVRPDPGTGLWPDSRYYLFDDGRHVIEIEVAPRPVSVSLRFALCHPPSVDAALIELVRQLFDRLGMEARICEDVPSGEAQSFSADRLSEFSETVRRAVVRPRAAWVAQFGPDQFPATTRDVFERVILPRCEPGVPV